MHSEINSIRRVVRHGFTLIELLVVITIIVIVIATSGMTLGNAGQGISLTNAGNKFTQVIEMARQRAMTANSQTAVILITKGADASGNGRALTVLERKVGGNWTQLREWELLPSGIVVDLGASADNITFISKSPKKLPGTGNPPDYLGVANYEFATRIFLPGGGTSNPTESARLQFVAGEVVDGAVNYTRKNESGGPSNYYRVSVLAATGKTKVDRP